MHKLSPPWEGPFVISRNLNNGSYYLIDIWENDKSRTSGEETARPWNIAHLRAYYTWAAGPALINVHTPVIVYTIFYDIIKLASSWLGASAIFSALKFVQRSWSFIRSLGGFQPTGFSFHTLLARLYMPWISCKGVDPSSGHLGASNPLGLAFTPSWPVFTCHVRVKPACLQLATPSCDPPNSWQ